MGSNFNLNYARDQTLPLRVFDMNHSRSQCAEVIASLCPDWRAQEIRAVEFLDAGYSNSNYRFRYRNQFYVLRIARSRGKPLHVNRSHEKRILNEGIPSVTPELIAFDEQTGNMVSRYIPGQLCIDLMPNARDVAIYLQSLHRNLAFLELDAHQLGSVINSNLMRAKEHGFSVPGHIFRTAATLCWEPKTSINCHNDLNPWNIICPLSSPDKWRTLDWEYAGGNDPLFDVICLSRGLSFSPAQEQELIERISPACSRQDVEKAIRAYLLREYSWAALQRASGNARDVVQVQLKNSERDLKLLS